MAAIELREISKNFGTATALSSLSLDIEDGEFLSLVGPSGCGKSTLLRIIAGLEEQSSGEVRIEGHSIDHLRAKQRDVAMVFQNYALYPHMTAGQNMALPLRMRRLSLLQRLPLVRAFSPGRRMLETDIAAEVQGVAALLGIEALLARKPSQLSGGQRQRVALGRAIVRRPRAFLMDEPLSNLDAKLRAHMRTEIAQLHRRLGTTFIYVTHDQAEAMTMSDRLAVMLDGKLLQVDTPAQVYAEPAHVKVAELIGSPRINLLPGRVHPVAIEVCGTRLFGRVALPAGEGVIVGIRPEALTIESRQERGWSGRVTHLENLGSEVLVHVAVEGASDPVIAKLDPHRVRIPSLAEEVRLQAETGRILIFDASGERATFTNASIEQVVNG
jgi:multiple sugar transport system ATP-binding protein